MGTETQRHGEAETHRGARERRIHEAGAAPKRPPVCHMTTQSMVGRERCRLGERPRMPLVPVPWCPSNPWDVCSGRGLVEGPIPEPPPQPGCGLL